MGNLNTQTFGSIQPWGQSHQSVGHHPKIHRILFWLLLDYLRLSLTTTFCQTLGLVLRLRVDFVLPLSQEEQEQQEQPLTKIYQLGVY